MGRGNAMQLCFGTLFFHFFLLFCGNLVSAYDHDQSDRLPLSILHHHHHHHHHHHGDGWFPRGYPREVPQELMPPPGHHLGVHYYASGFQVYTFNGTVWIPTNVTGHLRMRRSCHSPEQAIHILLPNATAPGGLQPTWINFYPFSLAGGAILASLPVHPDPVNANWVLLEIVHNEGDPRILGSVKYAQRLNTMGGTPPTNTSAQVGDIYKSPYKATYWFWVKSKCDSMDGNPQYNAHTSIHEE